MMLAYEIECQPALGASRENKKSRGNCWMCKGDLAVTFNWNVWLNTFVWLKWITSSHLAVHRWKNFWKVWPTATVKDSLPSAIPWCKTHQSWTPAHSTINSHRFTTFKTGSPSSQVCKQLVRNFQSANRLWVSILQMFQHHSFCSFFLPFLKGKWMDPVSVLRFSMRSIEPPLFRWTTMSQYSRVWRWCVTEMMVSLPNSWPNYPPLG